MPVGLMTENEAGRLEVVGAKREGRTALHDSVTL